VSGFRVFLIITPISRGEEDLQVAVLTLLDTRPSAMGLLFLSFDGLGSEFR
jgi:hypothetical protein